MKKVCTFSNVDFHIKIIEKIHAPVGVPIKAETPEEIAVSIAAELITVRNTIHKNLKENGTYPDVEVLLKADAGNMTE